MVIAASNMETENRTEGSHRMLTAHSNDIRSQASHVWSDKKNAPGLAEGLEAWFVQTDLVSESSTAWQWWLR